MDRYRVVGRYRDAIMDRDDYTCQLCGRPATDIDHIIPWARSHDSSPTNLRALCHACNQSHLTPSDSANPDWDEWLSWVRTGRAGPQVTRKLAHNHAI